MTLVLGTFDWVLLVLLVLIVSGATLAIARMQARRHAGDAVLGLRTQMGRLDQRLALIERRLAEVQSPPVTAATLPHPAPEQPSRHPPAVQPSDTERTVETLTRDAAAALSSLDAYRAFARTEGGSGFVVEPGSRACQRVGGSDPVSASDLWAVPFEDGYLYYPGWNLRRTQSALLADAGRAARDRLGWLFDIEAGEQLAATRPALQRPGRTLERGVLTMPLAG